MAIIVKHRRTGNEYILLGINGVGDRASASSRFFNDLFPREQSKNSSWVTICDARGNIFSTYLDNLVVVEIDGQKPGEILPDPIISTTNDEFEDENLDEEDWQQENVEQVSPQKDSSRENHGSDQADELHDDEDWI